MTWYPLPRFATWLLEHFGCGPNNHAMLGDLAEQYQQSPSRLSYWWQVLYAIAASVVIESKRNPLRILGAIAVGWFGYVAIGLLAFPHFVRLYPFVSWEIVGTLRPFLLMGMTSVFLLATNAAIGWVVSRASSYNRRTAVLAFAATYVLFRTATIVYGLLWMVEQYAGRPTPQLHIAMLFSSISAFLHVVVALIGLFVGGGLIAKSEHAQT